MKRHLKHATSTWPRSVSERTLPEALKYSVTVLGCGSGMSVSFSQDM